MTDNVVSLPTPTLGWLPVPDEMLEEMPPHGDLYALKCKGECMAPFVREGEHIILDPGERPVPGNLAVFWPKDGRQPVVKLLVGAGDDAYSAYMLKPFKLVTIPVRQIKKVDVVIGIVRLNAE